VAVATGAGPSGGPPLLGTGSQGCCVASLGRENYLASSFMRFSERIGKRAPKDVIQVDSMDDDLRNGLWNVVLKHIVNPFQSFFEGNYALSFSENYTLFLSKLWADFLKQPVDEIPFTFGEAKQILKELFSDSDYLEVYDLVDFIAGYSDSGFQGWTIIHDFNNVLQREVSAYRFVNGQLVPITNGVEMNAIEQAIQSSANSSYKGASIHLSAALEKLSDRREPDYRNSIKESISAVESVCQAITGDPKATLGPALKKIEQKMPLHGALKEGLLKIYGYTSDSDGIRHALQDEPNLSQEDALFMLVTCSAFVNYLTVKADKAGAAGS
jgi:hypothetical protein